MEHAKLVGGTVLVCGAARRRQQRHAGCALRVLVLTDCSAAIGLGRGVAEADRTLSRRLWALQRVCSGDDDRERPPSCHCEVVVVGDRCTQSREQVAARSMR